jgi:hypothetical protein
VQDESHGSGTGCSVSEVRAYPGPRGGTHVSLLGEAPSAGGDSRRNWQSERYCQGLRGLSRVELQSTAIGSPLDDAGPQASALAIWSPVPQVVGALDSEVDLWSLRPYESYLWRRRVGPRRRPPRLPAGQVRAVCRGPDCGPHIRRQRSGGEGDPPRRRPGVPHHPSGPGVGWLTARMYPLIARVAYTWLGGKPTNLGNAGVGPLSALGAIPLRASDPTVGLFHVKPWRGSGVERWDQEFR